MSCVNRHLDRATESGGEWIDEGLVSFSCIGRYRREKTSTHPSPNSQSTPFATFQHKSSSSRTFPNFRALFCPLCAFFCSFVILPLPLRPPGPETRWPAPLVPSTSPSRASRPRPTCDVPPSAASSSAAPTEASAGVLEIRYLDEISSIVRHEMRQRKTGFQHTLL